MTHIKRTAVLGVLLLTQPVSGFSANTNNMFGLWGTVAFQGDFKAISPNLDTFHWQLANQTRTRDDSPQGSRFTENLLWGQIGYQLNEHASIWLGYLHGWNEPLNNTGTQESRPYQDFVWKQNLGYFKFTSRTRMEERLHLSSNDTAYRPRQLLQLSHPLPFIDGLSVYLGDEVLFYLTKSNFGKQGFSENRIFSGLSYQTTQHISVDMGYLGQYIDTKSNTNLFTHNLQANISYTF